MGSEREEGEWGETGRKSERSEFPSVRERILM